MKAKIFGFSVVTLLLYFFFFWLGTRFPSSLKSIPVIGS